MREIGIDLSGRKPKRLTVEMQLHADWAVTMGCGDACPYVPTTVDDWDIPDPAGRPIDEVREIRDMIAGRVEDLADQQASTRSAPTAPRTSAARAAAADLIEEFGATALPRGHPRLRRPRSSTTTTTPRPHATSSPSPPSRPATACAKSTCDRPRHVRRRLSTDPTDDACDAATAPAGRVARLGVSGRDRDRLRDRRRSSSHPATSASSCSRTPPRPPPACSRSS